MTILRRLGLFACVLLFCGSLALWAFFVGIYGILNTPQPLEHALQDSGVYEEILPNTLAEQAATSPLPLRDIGVREAFQEALPATFFQQSAEQAINGTYTWMHGGSDKLEFSIDTTTARNALADNVAAHVREQMKSLPPCKHATPPPVSAQEALSLICMPQGVTPDAVANAARQEIMASNLLFEGDAITPTTLKNEHGEPLSGQLAFLPGAYSAYKLALVVLPLAAGAFACAVIYWSKTRKKGLRRVGWLALVTGMIGMVLAAVGFELFHMGVLVFGLPLPASPDMEAKLLATMESLAATARPWWLGITAGYTVLGIVWVIILRLRGPERALKFSKKQEL